ncbi:MAG TPA: BlaI/MecI/CopY family transcriptional regulator [Croceibacterium sp.]|nr:BlaI/MecI/CopY family transcriptional regulator [Croceibacterium sp.]
MLSSLPPRERQIVDTLYQRGPSVVGEICDALDHEVTGSAVRAMLKRLEDKGFVARQQSERGFVYAPSLPETTARKSALSQVVKVFFNDSPVGAVSALLGMQDRLDTNELDELERLIAAAREGRAK